MQTKILYEDKDILVVHKPAGIAVQSARIGQADVASELKNHLAAEDGEKGQRAAGKAPYLGVIHRLDQPVEGVLVFGKNQKAAAELSRQLKGADFCKEYLAVVCGKPQAEKEELVDYLLKEDGRAVVYTEQEADKSLKEEAGAKKAVLHFELLCCKETESGKVSLLRVWIETGRFHQIRAQLSHAGFPILGDSKYGSEESIKLSNMLGVRNTALCAERLGFMHPVSKKKMEYTVSPANPAFAVFKE